jgi:hypothetical protein
MSIDSGKRDRNAIAREQLEPLRPGERPRVVTVCALLALAIAIANLAATVVLIADGQGSPSLGTVAFALLMLVIARALWTLNYWAVLGFQALLAVVMMLSFLSLILVNDAVGLLTGLFALIGAGVLFWLMVKAMARIQMPE